MQHLREANLFANIFLKNTYNLFTWKFNSPMTGYHAE